MFGRLECKDDKNNLFVLLARDTKLINGAHGQIFVSKGLSLAWDRMMVPEISQFYSSL